VYSSASTPLLTALAGRRGVLNYSLHLSPRSGRSPEAWLPAVTKLAVLAVLQMVVLRMVVPSVARMVVPSVFLRVRLATRMLRLLGLKATLPSVSPRVRLPVVAIGVSVLPRVQLTAPV